MARIYVLFVVLALFVAVGVPAIITNAGEDDGLEKLKGNWSILWLAGQRPRRTGFVAELSAASLVLREEEDGPSAVIAVAESFLRFLRLLGTQDDVQGSSSVLPAWLSGLPRVVNARVSREGVHLTDCPTEGVAFARPQHYMEAAFGTVFETPQTVRLPVDGTCAQAPFTVWGYWLERLSKDEILMVIMVRVDDEDNNAVFHLCRRLEGGNGVRSSITSAALLVTVALIKFFPILFWKRKGETASATRVIPNPLRPALSELRRRELLRRQEEIIQRMKEEDGRS
ncbi:hypothetical protein MOQ_008462 [Trypanosoma cruzi marinkellei]|uniref:Trans-sialidase n=1 Tax=Trypanosoma cruzi marinkellei TaxID=85056 RepID=K2MKX8_TRYCR|nr:hypothetical protein MOQ_008462 [Trypanosoma cruzi marinkellei]